MLAFHQCILPLPCEARRERFSFWPMVRAGDRFTSRGTLTCALAPPVPLPAGRNLRRVSYCNAIARLSIRDSFSRRPRDAAPSDAHFPPLASPGRQLRIDDAGRPRHSGRHRTPLSPGTESGGLGPHDVAVAADRKSGHHAAGHGHRTGKGRAIVPCAAPFHPEPLFILYAADWRYCVHAPVRPDRHALDGPAA